MDALKSDLFVSGSAWPAVRVTFEEAALGLLIAAIPAIALAVLMGLSPLVEIILYPIVVLLQAIPKVAFAPILLLVFGYGISSKIALAVMVAFFPVLVNAVTGMRAARLDEIDLLRSMQGSAWQIFTKVRVRRAIPSIFAGLQVGFVFALLGAVFGEFVGGTAGLGTVISIRSAQLDIPGVFSGIIEISVLGVVASLILRLVGSRISNWQES